MKMKVLFTTCILAGAFIFPLSPAYAALTSVQIQAVLNLLSSFGAEQSVIDSVRTSLGAPAPTKPPTGNTNGCEFITGKLSRTLSVGSSGDDVAALQRFLTAQSVFSRTITAYFGPATQKAVQLWQSQHGVVTSGSPETTGYGIVGTMTRAAIESYCVGATPVPTPTPTPPPTPTPTPAPTATLSASPTSITSGQATTLSWSSTNATSCSASGFSGSGTSGSSIVSPTTNTTYSISCTGANGTSSTNVSVTVTAPSPTPTPTPTPPPTTSSAFIEEFTGNTGLERFRRGVYHRNVGTQESGKQPNIWGDGNAVAGHGGHWTADHDMACGTPDTQRPLSSSGSNFNVDSLFFTCKDHLMTSMGDVDNYSLVWFSPNVHFHRATHKKVSWDVNVTDLGGRQWWEVSIVPEGGKFLATVDWLSAAGLDKYDPESVIVGSGPFGGDVNITTSNTNRYDGWQRLCGDFALDATGCASKMIRRTFTVTDNDNGTITVNYGGMLTKTVPGTFPEHFEVYFKDHNYTPDKDGTPAGHTWHWDTIRVE